MKFGLGKKVKGGKMAMEVLNENHTTIQGWMINNLNLKGYDLLIYALIYGFSQDGESKFYGSRSYICEWFKISLPTVDKSLKFLTQKQYIIKHSEKINGVTFNQYSANLQILQVVKNFEGGGKNSLHNNKYINKNNNTLSILSHSSNELENEKQEQDVQPVRRTDNDYNTTFKAKKTEVIITDKVNKEVVGLSRDKTKEKEIEDIFDYWNSKQIIVHKTLTEETQKAILKMRKKYAVEEIKQMMDRYKQVLENGKYFFNYKWSLKDFLSRKNGAVDFAEDGSKWQDYCNKTGTAVNNHIQTQINNQKKVAEGVFKI